MGVGDDQASDSDARTTTNPSSKTIAINLTFLPRTGCNTRLIFKQSWFDFSFPSLRLVAMLRLKGQATLLFIHSCYGGELIAFPSGLDEVKHNQPCPGFHLCL